MSAIKSAVNYWSNLPMDLQIMTLQYVIAHDQRIDYNNAASQQSDFLPCALTCKSMNESASHVFYEQNTFIVKALTQYTGFGPVLSIPNPAIGHKMRPRYHHGSSFRTVHVGGSKRTAISPAHQRGSALPQRCKFANASSNIKARVWDPQQSAWQDRFSKLRTFKIRLKPGAENSEGCKAAARGPGFAFGLAERVKDTHIPIRAKNICLDFDMIGKACLNSGLFHLQGIHCGQILMDVIRDKLDRSILPSFNKRW